MHTECKYENLTQKKFPEPKSVWDFNFIFRLEYRGWECLRRKRSGKGTD